MLFRLSGTKAPAEILDQSLRKILYAKDYLPGKEMDILNTIDEIELLRRTLEKRKMHLNLKDNSDMI